MFSQLCRNVVPIAPGHATDDGFTASVISAALGEEIDRPLHLLEGWGGGFEAVRLVGGNLIRLGSQLSLNFFAAPEKTRSNWRLWFVPGFRHIEYWHNRTVVQSVEHRVRRKRKHSAWKKRCLRRFFSGVRPQTFPPSLFLIWKCIAWCKYSSTLIADLKQ